MPQKNDRATDKLEAALSALERAMEAATRIIADAIDGLRKAVAAPRRRLSRGTKKRRR